MTIKFSWELSIDMPAWVEKLHDYVWEDNEDESD